LLLTTHSTQSAVGISPSQFSALHIPSRSLLHNLSHFFTSNRACRFSKYLVHTRLYCLRPLLTPQILLQQHLGDRSSWLKESERDNFSIAPPSTTRTSHGNRLRSQSLSWTIQRTSTTTARPSKRKAEPIATRSCPTKTRLHQQRAPAIAYQPHPYTTMTENNTTATSPRRPSHHISHAPLRRVQSAA